MSLNIEVTPKAQKHFAALIAQEEIEGLNLRMFLDQPGSPKAEVGISFCPKESEKESDLRLVFDDFIFFVDAQSAPFLEEAKIDFESDDNLGEQLSITAPHIRGKKPDSEASLKDKIVHVLNSEVNPSLASHGGMVSLVELTEDNVVVLRFGGGCQGCGMVDVTLKHGIEKNLLEQFSELKGVKDVTDHTTGENPYYT